MAIPADKELKREAIPEKTYDSEWIRAFSVKAPSKEDGNIYIETIAYDSTSEELNPAMIVTSIRRSDFWEMVAEVPEAAAAMQAVFGAVPKMKEWIAAKEAELEEEV